MSKFLINEADSTMNCVSVMRDGLKTHCKWERTWKDMFTVYLVSEHSSQRNDDTTRTGGDQLTVANGLPL